MTTSDQGLDLMQGVIEKWPHMWLKEIKKRKKAHGKDLEKSLEKERV